MSLATSTKSIIDTMNRAFGSQIPTGAILGSNVTTSGVKGATDLDGGLLPGGLYYPGARTQHTVTVDAVSFTGTVHIEGSRDNATWHALIPSSTASGTAPTGADITAPGVYVFTGTFQSIRLNVTALSAGTINAVTIDSGRA